MNLNTNRLIFTELFTAQLNLFLLFVSIDTIAISRKDTIGHPCLSVLAEGHFPQSFCPFCFKYHLLWISSWTRMKKVKTVILFHIILVICISLLLISLVVWDHSSQLVTITGRCVWVDYCLWIG